MNPAELRRFLRAVRRDFKAPKPIRVRQRRLVCKDGYHFHGQTFDCGDHFLIELHPAAPPAVAKDTLLHEIAHCFSFGDRLHHSAKWAAKFAELTRWLAGEAEYAWPPEACKGCGTAKKAKRFDLCLKCRRERG